MKKTILTVLATTAAVAGALAQGQVAWAPTASNGGLISYSTDKVTSTAVPVGNPGQIPTYGALNIDFFVAPVGTALTLANGLPNFTSVWVDAGPSVTFGQTKVSPGRQSFTLNVPAQFTAGNDVQLEVVGWAGTATSWSAAAAGGATLLGFEGETFNGSQLGALSWDQPTGNPQATPTPGLPASITIGPSGYAGLVLEPVPEPATIALGGLGAAALLFFRRRK
jgi:hypothetical protein